jgi:GNAT superfamily N-acetyltransferase
MSSFKKLKSSDVTLSPYVANKQWSVNQCYPSSGSYFTIYKGTKLTSSFDPYNDPVTEGQYEGLIYDSINHMFYQSYSGSLLNTHSLASSLFYESASEQRRTESYFVYNENPAFISNFPSGSNDGIRILIVNKKYRGIGLAKEIINFFSEFFYKQYKIENIFLGVDINNKNAIKAYIKTGFTYRKDINQSGEIYMVKKYKIIK